MRKFEQRSRIRYVKSDFIPGTDVLAVDRKETGLQVGAIPSNPDPSLLREAGPGGAIVDEPTTDRNEPASDTASTTDA